MKKIVVLFVALIIILASCTTARISYTQESDIKSETAKVTVLLSRAVPQLSVIMNDKILLDSRGFSTKKVIISDVPIGENKIKMIANSWQLRENFTYRDSIMVKSNSENPLTREVPQYSTMYWVYVVGIGVASVLPSIIVIQ